MRGKPAHGGDAVGYNGITPAGAGKTRHPCCAERNVWDHPRRCGENPTKNKRCLILSGSPPQVRGKPSLPQIQPTCVRITPAGAGKTLATSAVKNYAKDHPRRCGENFDIPSAKPNMRGSPPQVRGKHPARVIASRKTGITPAGAGKTPKIDANCTVPEDHPRRCGENMIKSAKFNPLRGSPPQVRGKRRWT